MKNEPVAWIDKDGKIFYTNEIAHTLPLYTHPVELTDEEIQEVIRKHWNKEYGNRNMLTLCKAVLKEAQEK